ncbi:hypothetical protein EDI_240720 [Entamoeba dispar SAW760]|uniref:Ras-GAP domain-containing protein n=1 Tax=Entamoeba dispar (strain ATCC PRA-260 / SAW760) TaxID=370354 RepID=B0ERC3_ENTDS|nr:uncharacterized protein EDI_240720 [Entamoeba dispar SAW760]EDR22914.1 hypothetical protein EDI_240720 [Entamoeba dispar SAW760]|eukprot:EDR22914.1 hypothetical protein EDI_240720 [Entamoeba dispar SAW760]
MTEEIYPPSLDLPSPRYIESLEFQPTDPKIKEKFDKLLFSNDHVLLEALTQTLIIRSPCEEATKNAHEIMMYYFHHGRMNSLFTWAFEKELCNKGQETNTFFSPDSLFLQLYHEYAKEFLMNYLLTSLKPSLEELVKPQSRRISLSSGIQSLSFDDESQLSKEDYKAFQDFLVRLISQCNDNLSNNCHDLPQHFSQLIQSISAILRSHRVNKRDIVKSVFRELFYNYTLSPLITNAEKYIPGACSIDYINNRYRLNFFRTTLENLHSRDCHPQDNFLFEIMPLISNPDPCNDILSYLLKLPYEEKYQIDTIQCHQDFNTFIVIIKENILTTLDFLPRRIGDDLIDLVGACHFVLDDYQIYRSLMDSINLYNEDYNTQMCKSIAILDHTKNEIKTLEKQFLKLQKSLNKIQNENLEMQTKLELTKPFSIVLENKYQKIPFDIYLLKHEESTTLSRKKSDNYSLQSDDKTKKGFGLFKRNKKGNSHKDSIK